MYLLRSNNNIIKARTLDGYKRKLQKLHDYWFNVVLLPPTAINLVIIG